MHVFKRIVDIQCWLQQTIATEPFFNGYESRQAEHLASAIAEAEPIAIPGVVLTEILLGLKNDAEAERISILLDAFDTVAEPTRVDYIEAARIYRLCRARGFTVRSTIDCLIAQLCLRDGFALLTKDRDFKAIADCVPLQLLDS